MIFGPEQKQKKGYAKPPTAPQKPANPSGLSGRLAFATQAGITAKPQLMMLIGEPGIGKTAFCSEFPSPVYVFDKREDGISDLQSAGVVSSGHSLPAFEDWYDLLGLLDELVTQQHDWKTIVIETVGSVQQAAWKACCEEKYNGDFSDKGFLSFYAGPAATANEYWPQFLDALLKLHAAGMHVVLTGHSEKKKIENPNGPDYNSEVAICDNRCWVPTAKMFATILVMSLEIDVVYKITKRGGDVAELQRGKVRDMARILHCDKGATSIAKNRFGRTEPIECGTSHREAYRNFCEAAGLDPATAMKVV